jgi:hypothetical protein
MRLLLDSEGLIDACGGEVILPSYGDDEPGLRIVIDDEEEDADGRVYVYVDVEDEEGVADDEEDPKEG